jgi:hypothetical protein
MDFYYEPSGSLKAGNVFTGPITIVLSTKTLHWEVTQLIL